VRDGTSEDLLKRFVYGTGTGPSDHSAGKMIQASRFRFVEEVSLPTEVREVFTYAGRQERLSTKRTEL
jgi:hypothetical protein